MTNTHHEGHQSYHLDYDFRFVLLFPIRRINLTQNPNPEADPSPPLSWWGGVTLSHSPSRKRFEPH